MIEYRRLANQIDVAPVCRTGAVKPTSFPPSVVTAGAAYEVLFLASIDITGEE